MNIYDSVDEIREEVLNDGRLYVYAILNYPQGNVKVGVSTNVEQRIRSLSGSNTGGNKIVRIAVSPATYLYTMEANVHNHFNDHRIENTEWFSDLNFYEVVRYIDSLFDNPRYPLLNSTRKDYPKNMCIKS